MNTFVRSDQPAAHRLLALDKVAEALRRLGQARANVVGGVPNGVQLRRSKPGVPRGHERVLARAGRLQLVAAGANHAVIGPRYTASQILNRAGGFS
ncbi:hypothetical protein [Cupriavidus sp. L7L]|uniref:hypothetical protein n=1 Tax=Cupriavidus sp. L7L TaxID=2546443 RepID=UPI0010543D2B|nr:hypothetical protein [Cupriavidus sp. L7L]TDF63143.1 hypothetical protein E1J61_25600 [Cupriavidus sp. L7L]